MFKSPYPWTLVYIVVTAAVVAIFLFVREDATDNSVIVSVADDNVTVIRGVLVVRAELEEVAAEEAPAEGASVKDVSTEEVLTEYFSEEEPLSPMEETPVDESNSQLSYEPLEASEMVSDVFEYEGRSHVSLLGEIQKVEGRVITINREGMKPVSVYIGEQVIILGLRETIMHPEFEDLKPGLKIQIMFRKVSEDQSGVEPFFVKLIRRYPIDSE